MRKANLEVGGIYSRTWGDPVLLLSKDIITWRPRNEWPYSVAPRGTRPQEGTARYSGFPNHGYLVAVGSAEDLKKIDAEKAFASLLEGRQELAALRVPDTRVSMVFSLATLVGPYGEVEAHRAEALKARAETNRRRTEDHNSAVAHLNALLEQGDPLEERASWHTWSDEPEITLSLKQVGALLRNVERIRVEAYARGAKAVENAMMAQVDAGELVIIPRDYDDEE
jgi:hypothetical protein